MAKQISDTSQLFNLNKLLSERVDLSALDKDHQLLKDLHLALDADTKRITDKIRKNAQNLRADFDDHKDETKENFNHVHQSHKHHEEMIRNTNHRQDTMAEHLKLVLVNSRTTRAKMESVFEVHETQVAKFTKMEKDYDELNTSFKQMGREIGAMFDEMEDAKKAKELEKMAGQKLDTTDQSDKRASFNEQSMAFNKAQEQAAERKKKKTDEASGVSMIAKAISDLAKQVQQSDSDISDLKDGIYTANNNINENVKRVGKYERFVTTVEIQVEQQAVQMTDVLATSQDMFSTINKNGKILNDTSRKLDTHSDYASKNLRNLNATAAKLEEDVGLAHDYFTGLRTGFKDKVVDDMLPSRARSAMQELAALPAPAASFGKPKKLPALQDKSGSASAR
jgi:chromosome segregation ATPase